VDQHSRGHGGSLRRARRQPIRLPGSVQERDAPFDAEVVDLSAGGCLVRCGRLLDRERVVDVALDLPAGRVRAKARVVECSRDGEALPGGGVSYLTGLEFLSMSDRDAEILRRLVDVLANVIRP
jgi:c-di-GMP-binding flagellar brake protein YcgR